MILKDTGLLPEKRITNKLMGGLVDKQTMYDEGFNYAIDQISAIPFDPVKYVEVDEGELKKIVKEACLNNIKNQLTHQGFLNELVPSINIVDAIIENKSKWLKEKR